MSDRSWLDDETYFSSKRWLCLRRSLLVAEIDHTTIINWVKEKGEKLSDDPQQEEIHEITEIDELQTPTHPECIQGGKRSAFRTFVGCKKNKFWVWTVVNHSNQGILLWTIGDRCHKTFEPIWQIIKCWRSFWYVTDGWKVYPMYIKSEDHLVSKTYMTRVERENTRPGHYQARLHRKTLCYSKSVDMLRYSIRLLLFYLKFKTIPVFA